jgi:hypothetical protein
MPGNALDLCATIIFFFFRGNGHCFCGCLLRFHALLRVILRKWRWFGLAGWLVARMDGFVLPLVDIHGLVGILLHHFSPLFRRRAAG